MPIPNYSLLRNMGNQPIAMAQNVMFALISSVFKARLAITRSSQEMGNFPTGGPSARCATERRNRTRFVCSIFVKADLDFTGISYGA